MVERASAARSTGELVLGRYRPLAPLGSGSSGSVWRARDEQTGLDVALKIVSHEGKAGARAEREAGAARKLRHKHCQRIYDHGSDGRHVYIAYEYVPGSTFREATRSGRLTDAATIEAAVQVLEALAHAHARGIVHRDVKPANVLLTDGPQVSVRLLDFGLARFAEADTLTAVGDVPGTLAYIAPERLRGEQATPASDVWSVGVMLWEALAGRHPFWAASLVTTSKKIAAGAPSLASARPDLPRALAAIVADALQLDPRRRPGAAQLAERLRRATRVREAVRRPRKQPKALEPVQKPTRPSPLTRVLPGVLAALFGGWTASTLPFYPAGWAAGLAVVAAVLTLVSARGGLALALAVPIFPLGNISLGLALLYLLLAAAWYLLHLRDPGTGLAFAVGPLLLPVAAFALIPLALQPVRRTWRRALHAGTGVLLAAVVAGIDGRTLPFAEGHAPALGIAGSGSPFYVATALRHALSSHPSLALEALVIAVAAAVLPFARRRAPWGLAVFGAALAAGTVLAAPHAGALPAVLAAWATALGLALWDTRSRWLPTARSIFGSPLAN